MHKWIAHRGASAEAPENTLAAFRLAFDLRVDGIECDVHMTRDGRVVVIHDTHIGRTTTSEERLHVADLTLQELQALDAGGWFSPRFKGETIPTLEELIQLTPNELPLMIEIKRGHSSPTALAKAVVDIVNRYPRHTLLLGSFSLTILKEVHRLNPALTLIGIAEKAVQVPPLLQLPLKRLALWHKLIDDKGMYYLRQQQVKVWTFTVDDAKRAEELILMGVEGIITNDPRKLKFG